MIDISKLYQIQVVVEPLIQDLVLQVVPIKLQDGVCKLKSPGAPLLQEQGRLHRLQALQQRLH